MNVDHLQKILSDVREGKLAIDEAMHQLRSLPYDDVEFAKVDTHRELRTGFPEVIFCRGKTPDQVARIAERLSSRSTPILATKAEPEIYQAVRKICKDAVYHEVAKIIVIGETRQQSKGKPVLVVSAGTSDIPIVEEAAVTATAMGQKVERLFDVGVAGVHRLLDNRDKLHQAGVIIVVAGMEGALASVIGGLVDQPVIAVPTSVGYGASFEGLAALLSMLNCCAPGVVVVNIDNGFGAGYCAAMINRQADKR